MTSITGIDPIPNNKQNTSQLRFVDGNLVEQSTEAGNASEHATEPILPRILEAPRQS